MIDLVRSSHTVHVAPFFSGRSGLHLHGWGPLPSAWGIIEDTLMSLRLAETWGLFHAGRSRMTKPSARPTPLLVSVEDRLRARGDRRVLSRLRRMRHVA